MGRLKSYITPLLALFVAALGYGLWNMYIEHNLLDYLFGMASIKLVAAPSFILNLMINLFAKEKSVKLKLQWVTFSVIVLIIAFLLVCNP
jgi:ABC-type dipeptide/oligopeptide/nickel transport system permease component